MKKIVTLLLLSVLYLVNAEYLVKQSTLDPKAKFTIPFGSSYLNFSDQKTTKDDLYFTDKENLYLAYNKINSDIGDFLAENQIKILMQDKEFLFLVEVTSENQKRLLLRNGIYLDNVYKYRVRVPQEISIRSNFVKPEITDREKSIIDDLLNQVNQDSIKSYMQFLQDMGTRYIQAPNRRKVAFDIKDKFVELGVENAKVDSFLLESYTIGEQFPDTWQYNVVAEIPGTSASEDMIIVGGHHDSIVGNVSESNGQDPYFSAPGADDNASAVSAALEMARIFVLNNYQPKHTFQFQTYAAEEHGKLGSLDLANRYYSEEKKIKLMFNNDMISYSTASEGNWESELNVYTGAAQWGELTKYCFDTYTNVTLFPANYNHPGSDSYSYFLYGYPALFAAEHEFTPFYHQYADTVGTCNMAYFRQNVMGSMATVLHADLMPDDIKDFSIADTGTGTSLELDWSGYTPDEGTTYKVFLGIATESYDQSFVVDTESYSLTGLTSGTEYFIGVQAVGSNGFESLITEKSFTPLNLPRKVADFNIVPETSHVTLSWKANTEADITGYKVYKCLTTEGEFSEIFSTTSEFTFTDNNLEEISYYSYLVRAIDSDGNESAGADTISTRLLTLNNGVLIVDESKGNVSATLEKPSDEMLDEFYNKIFTNVKPVETLDVYNLEKLRIEDLGAYSSVFWHNFNKVNNTKLNEYQDVLRNYLARGGNLFLNVAIPSYIDGLISYTANYETEDFLKEYAYLDSSIYSQIARINGASSLKEDFTILEVDTAKARDKYENHISGLESLYSSQEDDFVYKFTTTYTDNYGVFADKTCGVYHENENNKVFLLTLPLYYAKEYQAKLLVDNVFSNFFGESVGIEEELNSSEHKDLYLAQNYPNPFNPLTSIKYSIKDQGMVQLSVFNSNGQLVNELVNKNLKAGNYTVRFNAESLNSGVYFYQLKSANKIITKKMILIK